MAKAAKSSGNSPTSLHYLTFILQQSSDELLNQRVGIGLSQTRILGTLSPTFAHSQRAIAWQLDQTEANVSRQLRLMQKKGLVNIKRNKKDGRQRDVVLSSKGRQKYRDAQRILRAQQAQLLNRVGSGQIKAFNSSVDHIIGVLHASSISRKLIG
jgi:DNA-binding MarR family transcriptional regulator